MARTCGWKVGQHFGNMTSPAGAPNKEIDCLSPEAQRLAEARLAAKRAARAEAREIRMKELERQQKEVEERPDKDFTEKGSRNMPSLSAATLASLGGTSSRRGSGDTSISMDTEASIREIKDSLAEAEEKYKKAMVSNAQLDNEKTNFMYQVDTLKDMLLELEEQLAESQRQYEEKNKEFERERHAHSILQFQFAEVKEALRQREEMLEKHGIILNSEIATNGETSDTVNDVGYQGPTKITSEELTALKSAGEGTLGKAKEVEVKKEIVEHVGKREPLQNTEQEQPKPSTVKDCVDRGVSHPGENAEDQKPAEDSALSPGPLAEDRCEQEVQNQDQESTSFLQNPEQMDSCGVTHKPEGRTRNAPEQANCLGGPDSEMSGPTTLGIENQSENSIGNQDKDEQEDLKTDLEEVSLQPCPDYVLGQTPAVDKVNSTDSRGAGENHTENVLQAGGNAAAEQVGPAASGPLEQSKGSVSHGGTCVNDGVGQSSELAQVAEPEEAFIQSPQAGEENTVTEVGDTKVREEKLIQAEVQATSEAPIVQSSHQDTTGLGSTDAKHASRHGKEPNKEKTEQQAEALDSPQRKAKNKKKRNKKKKAPVPVETCKDANEELDCQNTEVGGMEEEQVQMAENPEQDIGAGSSEHVSCPKDPETPLNGKQKQEEQGGEKTQAEKVTADRDMVMFEADTVQSLDTRAVEETEEQVTEGPAVGPMDVLDQNSLQCEDGAIFPVGKKGLPRDASDASQTGSDEEHAPSQHLDQVEKAVNDHSLDNRDLSGELGDFSSESGDQTRVEVGDGKNKDCTMS